MDNYDNLIAVLQSKGIISYDKLIKFVGLNLTKEEEEELSEFIFLDNYISLESLQNFFLNESIDDLSCFKCINEYNNDNIISTFNYFLSLRRMYKNKSDEVGNITVSTFNKKVVSIDLFTLAFSLNISFNKVYTLYSTALNNGVTNIGDEIKRLLEEEKNNQRKVNNFVTNIDPNSDLLLDVISNSDIYDEINSNRYSTIEKLKGSNFNCSFDSVESFMALFLNSKLDSFEIITSNEYEYIKAGLNKVINNEEFSAEELIKYYDISIQKGLTKEYNTDLFKTYLNYYHNSLNFFDKCNFDKDYDSDNNYEITKKLI